MESAQSKKPYFGVDRRKYERRVVEDRRVEIRWEPGKDDRRSDQNRRQRGLPEEDPWNRAPKD